MKKFYGAILGALLAHSVPASAQWLTYPEANIPRKNGKLDVNAPTPRLPGGKPNLAGMWKQFFDADDYAEAIAGGIKNRDLLKPWALDLLEKRIATDQRDDPSSFCLPSGIVIQYQVSPFKIIHQGDHLVMLFDINTTFREVFLDGRPFPTNPVPTYMGYAVGHWEGDTLVVESMGYNGKFWLDAEGRPSTEQLRLTERFTRTSFGRMVHEITVNDPGAYTKPWTTRSELRYMPDAGLMESYCEENTYPEQLRQLQQAEQKGKEKADADTARANALRDAVADPRRPQSDRAQDAARKPAETLAFFGLRPGMSVLDLLAGGGYFTDILSNAVGANGKVYSHNTKLFLSFEGKPYEARFEPGRLANVTRIEQELGDLHLPGPLDMILMSLVWHDTYYEAPAAGMPRLDRAAVLAKLFAALKPGGILAVIDHSARPGRGSADAEKLHRLDEALLKKEFAAAGFFLEDESDLLRNPDDDRRLAVFEDKVRGKTDRFVLRFRRP